MVIKIKHLVWSAAVIILLAAGGIGLWLYLRPTDENLIRTRFARLASLATKNTKEGALPAAARAKETYVAGKIDWTAAKAALDAATAALVNAAKTGTKKTDFSQAQIAPLPDVVYTSYAITPDVTVTLGDQTLTEDTDYTLAITNNVEVGEATVTATGTGAYDGEITATFQITSLAKAKKAEER